MFKYLKKYILFDEYSVRFILVMFIWYYIDLEYLDEIFNIIDNIKNDKYYVRMAIAWLISICYVKYEDITMKYLKNTKLDDFTYNKSIQKIIESNQVSSYKKNEIKNMKRLGSL